MEYYSTMKKNEILPFAKVWLDLEDTMLSEISDKDKYYMLSLICGILKINMYMSKQMHKYGEHTSDYQ